MPSVSILSDRAARAIPPGEPPAITAIKVLAQLRAGIEILEGTAELDVTTIQTARTLISSAQRKLLVMQMEMQNRVHGAALAYRQKRGHEVHA